VLVRGDTGEYLSVVGKGYEVVQFAEVARTLVEAAGDVKAVFTTAGMLHLAHPTHREREASERPP
jgi:hypothetical protein